MGITGVVLWFIGIIRILTKDNSDGMTRKMEASVECLGFKVAWNGKPKFKMVCKLTCYREYWAPGLRVFAVSTE